LWGDRLKGRNMVEENGTAKARRIAYDKNFVLILTVVI
jgi:hypothetical protein